MYPLYRKKSVKFPFFFYQNNINLSLPCLAKSLRRAKPLLHTLQGNAFENGSPEEGRPGPLPPVLSGASGAAEYWPLEVGAGCIG